MMRGRLAYSEGGGVLIVTALSTTCNDAIGATQVLISFGPFIFFAHSFEDRRQEHRAACRITLNSPSRAKW